MFNMRIALSINTLDYSLVILPFLLLTTTKQLHEHQLVVTSNGNHLHYLTVTGSHVKGTLWLCLIF